ncbi:MAG: serine-type D-Ala-D-Ala carboxypeptidase, partial [Alphaproteobacteria bacterium]|nr:serine-type D-Ala-D-Ala carboxypeptidase [Alphaproteobacteria bacterium]
PVAPEKAITLSLLRSKQKSIKVDMTVYPEIEAPVTKGQVMGKAVVSADGIAPIEVSLIATEDDQRLGWFDALIAKIKRKLGKA